MNARGIRCRHSGPFAQKPAVRKILGSDGSRAFTLIEMITVVGIIMILSFLAISTCLHAKNHAYEILARYDLRNLVEYEEAFFAKHDRYKPYTGPSDFPGMKLSPGVTLATAGNPESPADFTARGWHENSGKLYIYRFNTGLLEETAKP
jgi:type II secretory pathway pseudopilin PulG